MPRQKIVDNKDILLHLAEKYSLKRNHYVFRLSYAGKYVIVKGKTLSGSLFLIHKGFTWFREKSVKPGHLYQHLYKYVQETLGGRFRVKVILSTKNHYAMLKREQNELDKARYDPNCLNANAEAYIPQFNPTTEEYGWIPKMAVLNFQKYLKSDRRKSLLQKCKLNKEQAPAMSA